jgi:hypothetical protein
MKPFIIHFEPGLPPHGNPCIFLMWDGSLCEGFLQHENGHRMLTTYNLVAKSPEQIKLRAATGKVQAYAELTGHPRSAA